MINVAVTTTEESKKVLDAADKAAFKNFGHAAARISKDAKESIVKASGPSQPGKPVHTHKGQFIRRAIRFDATKTSAVIGPVASVVGQVGNAHEFGGEFKGEQYPARPFMAPALTQNLDRFAGEWRGSIGE